MRILLGLFFMLFGFSLCYLGLFYVIWLFVMCGECCNFKLFGLFTVILIDLSPLIFFSKTKVRVSTSKSIFFEFIYIY